ncbi:MAG: GYDIA family GHMP kinase [Owenweeksia sp.]
MQPLYRANGKLLITGEYAVLLGAEALAIPTRFGQTLAVENHERNKLLWTALDHRSQVWFKAEFDRHLNIISSTDESAALYLKKLIQTALQLGKLPFPTSLHLKTSLDFPNNWGLGSSSTLISLIAQWSGIDAMTLFKETSTGSGYDVACATADHPIIYTLTEAGARWERKDLPPAFDEVLFVHLNQKQRSAPEVSRFKASADFDRSELVQQVSALTQRFLNVSSATELSRLIDEHEALLSPVLKLPTLNERLFPDFEGSVKSLGAWGGDFIMALGPNAHSYFRSKGFTTCFSLKEIALH